MKIAGVVFDFYDDPSGNLLKRSFPTPEALPDIVKEAHILSQEERDVLRNEAFALVMVNEGRHFRKFACVDAGNTVLSTLYFLNNWRSLPTEAVKTACANLMSFCEEFGLPTDGLAKVAAASGMSRTRDPLKQAPYTSDDGDWAQRTNLLSVRGGADSGRVIPMANTMKTAGVVETDRAGDPQPSPTPWPKKKEKDADIIKYTEREKHANFVDVSGKNPDVWFPKRASQNTALDGQYPLDSYADVQHAVRYFDDNYLEMLPEDRHSFCVKTAARASDLGIEVSEMLERYGSVEYSLDVDSHLAGRRSICEPEWKDVYTDLQEKRAQIEPLEFAKILDKVDREANLHWHWGSHISDPYFATFGGSSEKLAADWSWQGRVGDTVNAEQLKNLATNGRKLICKHFDKDVVEAFGKDPVSIFSSLPDDSKTILARLANDLGRDGWPAGN